jgi:large subunit ribosomal protein L15
VVNVGKLGELFPEGGDVTPEAMVAKGAARKGELIKVLGTGEVSVALRVTAHAFSGSARDKIQAAGGSATELS